LLGRRGLWHPQTKWEGHLEPSIWIDATCRSFCSTDEPC
jgi:hypothetical protein